MDVITSLIKPPETRFTNTRIHGITWEKVRNAPTFKEYYESMLHDFIKGYVLVAHNAQFDMGCLLHVSEVEGFPWISHYSLQIPAERTLCLSGFAEPQTGYNMPAPGHQVGSSRLLF